MSEMEDLLQILGKFEGYNEDQLFDELVKEVKRLKEKGLFDREDLQNKINILAPYISVEQRHKLENILEIVSNV